MENKELWSYFPIKNQKSGNDEKDENKNKHRLLNTPLKCDKEFALGII